MRGGLAAHVRGGYCPSLCPVLLCEAGPRLAWRLLRPWPIAAQLCLQEKPCVSQALCIKRLVPWPGVSCGRGAARRRAGRADISAARSGATVPYLYIYQHNGLIYNIMDYIYQRREEGRRLCLCFKKGLLRWPLCSARCIGHDIVPIIKVIALLPYMQAIIQRLLDMP